MADNFPKVVKDIGVPGWLSWLSSRLLISAQVMISESWDRALSMEPAWDSLSPSALSPLILCAISLSFKKKFKRHQPEGRSKMAEE